MISYSFVEPLLYNEIYQEIASVAGMIGASRQVWALLRKCGCWGLMVTSASAFDTGHRALDMHFL